MILKLSLLAIILLSNGRVFSASISDQEQSIPELLSKLLDSFSKRDSRPKPYNFANADESQTYPRVKPIPAPPPSPALGSVEKPVAWPYPPAPDSSNSEFPILENFLKSNGITNNKISSQWNEQIPSSKPTQWREQAPSQKLNQWNEQTPSSKADQWNQQAPSSKPDQWNEPSPSPKASQWNVQAPASRPIQWQLQSPLPKPTPTEAPAKWGVALKPVAPTQTPAPQYLEWGIPQKSQPAPSSQISIPPPLNREENFYIQHNGRNNQAQNKQFTLNSYGLIESKPENKENKLNVSFIMPPDIRPLSLNFDTGEVQIDLGDKDGRRVPIPAEAFGANKDYRTNLQLDQIFGTHTPKGSSAQAKPVIPARDEDDEYIVVRHDMNKYAYDLPKGMIQGTNAQAIQTSSISSQPQQQQQQQQSSAPKLGLGGTQTQQVEKYDVSGQKNLHFVLGRVSG